MVKKYQCFLIVKIDKNEKNKAMATAREHSTTLSELIRDYIRRVSRGEVETIFEFTVEEPGKYALVREKIIV